MFYSVQLLGKESPLGKLWLAAHADKRLKRHDINSTDVPQSVGMLLFIYGAQYFLYLGTGVNLSVNVDTTPCKAL